MLWHFDFLLEIIVKEALYHLASLDVILYTRHFQKQCPPEFIDISDCSIVCIVKVSERRKLLLK